MLLSKKIEHFMCGAVANTRPIYIQSTFEFDTHLVLGVGYKESHSFTFQRLHLIMSICSVVEHV